MNYYLPTSLKLLRQYEQLDAQGIEGKNISESKRQIEETMDTMVEAFEKQLDSMFAADSMDISADIAAMQNLMRADGLVDNELTETF
ncbi:MAG: 5-bromo-4-chloroindolyl phosphate hydrolysis family protein [Firmicutes bacterium]|nr:5-bromo-4-chloroindolyl phosphate hydrolysis family protein [Bacillota bacterium]